MTVATRPAPVTTKPAPGALSARLVLNIAAATLDRLEELSIEQGVKIGEIVRRAIGLYSYIAQAKAENPKARLLLDRGDRHPTELVIPF